MNDLLTAAVAMSLYQYNVAPHEKAGKLTEHFNRSCADFDDLVYLVESRNWATEMAMPTAEVFLQHALDRYGQEAKHRVEINLKAYQAVDGQ